MILLLSVKKLHFTYGFQTLVSFVTNFFGIFGYVKRLQCQTIPLPTFIPVYPLYSANRTNCKRQEGQCKNDPLLFSIS